MKILFKTRVDVGEYEKRLGDPMIVLDNSKQSFCCNELKRLNYGIAFYADFVEMIIGEEDYYRISFCPFCGEKFEFVEAYKYKQAIRTFIIPDKVIPGRKEKRITEIRIKE